MKTIPVSAHFRLTSPAQDLPRTVITDKRPRKASGTSGRVIGYRRALILHNVTFRVNTAESARIANGAHRSVHARAHGMMRTDHIETRSEYPTLLREVHYNPRRSVYFHSFDDDGRMRPVHSANVVFFTQTPTGTGRCFIE